MSPDEVGRIKACQGVYSLRDTARHFGTSPATIHAVWNGRRHSDIAEAEEPPNVETRRVSKEIVREDGRLILERGMSKEAAAKEIGVSKTTLYNHTREAPVLVVVP